jgi:hypothetical protein
VNRGGQRPQTWLRRRVRAARVSIRSVFVAWIAILALVGQLASAVRPHVVASPAQAEAAAALSALSALLGPNIEFCHQDTGPPDSPTHNSHSCCDDCALCHATGHLALAPPDYPAPAPFTRYAKPLGVQADASPARVRAVAAAQPRGPPVLV